MKRFLRSKLISALAVLIMLVCAFAIPLSSFITRTHATAASSQAAWNIIPSPNVGTSSQLNSVAVVSASDVWAVGYSSTGTLIEHWDGNSWSVITSPNPGTGISELKGVTVVSANDIWAVGTFWPSGSNGITLVEHWDGSNWIIVNSPNTVWGGELNSITAVSATDIWAVGWYAYANEFAYSLAEHWDGSNWSIVDSPNIGGTNPSNYLNSIAAVSSSDVWAVGSGSTGTLLEHWDGTSWSIDPSSGGNGSLWGVTAISSTDVWTVGSNGGTLTEHWNGTSWAVVSSPNAPSNNGNTLTSVAAVSPTDIWVVGYYTSLSGIQVTLTEHWDGTSWSIVDSPNQGTYPNGLYGVAAVSTSDIWAVGNYNTSSTGTQTLIEQYAPSTTPSPSPSPSPSPTPSPSPSPSPSPTPTITFTYPIASSNVRFTIGYGIQNPNLAGPNGCYWDSTTHHYVPFSQLWHAGEDWFAKTSAGATTISAVANGVVKYVSPPGYSYPGAVIIIQHTLADGSLVYSMYGHLDPKKLLIKVGDAVTKGQAIAGGLIVQKSEGGDNTHLHWEIRYFFDGSGITKGPNYKQTCSAQPGPGYTWPGQPDNFVFNGTTYRWTNPSQFVAAHM